MTSYVFRHGETGYSQGKVALAEANDLTLEGIKQIEASSSHLAYTINARKTNPAVLIFSSPFGRCLHSAKILDECLEKSGVPVIQIALCEGIEEVRDFDFRLFQPLALGGKVEYNGDVFTIDSKLTNPHGLSTNRYFREDALHSLPAEAINALPGSYAQRIKRFERASSAVKRLHSHLQSLPNRHIDYVLLTHEGLTGDLIERATGNLEAYLLRGRYFDVINAGGELIPSLPQANAVSIGEYK